MAAGILAACSSDKEGYCPTMASIAAASTLTVFRPGAPPDPSNLLYTIEIAHVKGGCDYDKHSRAADADLEIAFRATRPPTGNEARYSIPYFVAVTEGSERILLKKKYSVRFTFAPGQATANFSDTVGSTHIQPEKEKYPYDYQILVGLQLTKQQLDFNRSQGR